jgi:DNA-binding transcriptional MocR family regulator
MRARGLQCTADQVLIVQGTQQALELCAKLLIVDADRKLTSFSG